MDHPLAPIALGTDSRSTLSAAAFPSFSSTSQGLNIGNVLKQLAKGLRTSYTGTSTAPLPFAISTSSDPRNNQIDGIHITELFNRLNSDTDEDRRIEAAEIFTRAIRCLILPASIVEIWYAAQDMLNPANSVPTRGAAWNLLATCIQFDSDPDAVSVNKLVYYRAIVEYPVGEDFIFQLEAFKMLTKDGRELPVLGPSESPFVMALSNWFQTLIERLISRNTPLSEQALQEGQQTLDSLCSYIVNVVKFNYYAFDNDDIILLLQDLISLINLPYNDQLLTKLVTFIDTLLVYGNVPMIMLSSSVESLCFISHAVPEMLDSCCNAIAKLINSHLANNTVSTLHNVLRSECLSQQNTVLGSIIVLRKLLEVERNVISATLNLKVSSVMKSYRIALSNYESSEVSLCVFTNVIDLILGPATFSLFTLDDFNSQNSPFRVLISAIPSIEINHGSDPVYLALQPLFNKLYKSYSAGNFTGSPKFLALFYLELNRFLDEQLAESVVDIFANEWLCLPGSEEWEKNARALSDAFYSNSRRSLSLRIKTFDFLTDIYLQGMEFGADELRERDMDHQFLKDLFRDINHEPDMDLLQHVVSFGTSRVPSMSPQIFIWFLNTLSDCMHEQNNHVDRYERLSLPVESVQRISNSMSPRAEFSSDIYAKPNNSQFSRSSTSTGSVRSTDTFEDYAMKRPMETAATEIIAHAYVRIFLSSLELSGEKTALIYREILLVVQSFSNWNAQTILILFRLLFRIRVNSASRVLISHPTDMDGLAESLQRERGSMTPQELKLALWAYPETDAIAQEVLPSRASYFVTARGQNGAEVDHGSHTNSTVYEECTFNSQTGTAVLNISSWLSVIVCLIERGGDWDLYSYILAHMAPQISNVQLFCESNEALKDLRKAICEQLSTKIAQTVFPNRLTKSDVQVVLVRSMSSLIAYHSLFSRADQDLIVKAALVGLRSREKVIVASIHFLLICCYEFPDSMRKVLPIVFTDLRKKITNTTLSVHILDFLSGLARIPTLTSNFTQDDFKVVFAMAFGYMEHSTSVSQNASSSFADSDETSKPNWVLSEYLAALSHSVVASWFVTMKMPDRQVLAPYIVRGLLLSNGCKTDDIPYLPGHTTTASQERTWATIDLVLRFSYSSTDVKMLRVGEGLDTGSENEVANAWIFGFSIVTMKTFKSSGLTQLIIRKPTGSTKYTIYFNNRILTGWIDVDESESGHEARAPMLAGLVTPEDQLARLPRHFFTEFVGPAEKLLHSVPLLIPNVIKNQALRRAIEIYDRTPVVELHKIGIVYIGLNQCTEQEILANSVGSKAYLEFLDGMGQLTKLKGNRQIYTGGLDTESDQDGEYAYTWADKISQAVFHTTTLMPSRRKCTDGVGLQKTDGTYDPECLAFKKRHIGNNFVNIYWNESGLPFDFDVIKSQFNFINIVISPHTKASSSFSKTPSIASSLLGGEGMTYQAGFDFFKVRVYIREEVGRIALFSPANHLKLIGKQSLPLFIRNLAFNADIFAMVWHTGPTDEFLSSWQFRVRQAKRLRAKVETIIEEEKIKATEIGKSNSVLTESETDQS
ncbi:uncharacterized protein V1516DRAFT_632290 [Lipomyces oligophaga]|uniref:uncharacterized protein n=1 Tax=Lipomyces oligophaga TaxID=45792 RepID=UPI0034CF8387